MLRLRSTQFGWHGAAAQPGQRTLFVLASALTMLAACRKADTPQAKPADTVVVKSREIGQALPARTFATLSGDSVTVGGSRRQPVTLVNLWATWCSPCVREFPAVEALQLRYAIRGLRVLAVSIDKGDAPVKAFLMAHPVTFAIGRDPDGILQTALASQGVPELALVSADGRVLYRTNSVEAPELAKALDTALSAK